MEPFLVITKGAAAIELEIDTESARETEPEAVGSTERSFAGPFRSDREEFRTWQMTAVNLFPAEFDALRAMVAEDAEVVITGGAIGAAAPVTGVVRIGEAPFVDDARADEGFTRSAVLSIREG